MIGIYLLVIAGLYLYGAIILTKYAARKARKIGKPGWHYGLPVGLFCYLLVFWDHIPTLLVHKHQCDTKAGLVVHKTPEQWIQENPGVAETLSSNERSPFRYEDGRGVYQLNSRFSWVLSNEQISFGVRATHEQVVDTRTGEVLMEVFDANTDVQNFLLGNQRIRDFKIWLHDESCFEESKRSEWLFDGESFKTMKSKYKGIGEA